MGDSEGKSAVLLGDDAIQRRAGPKSGLVVRRGGAGIRRQRAVSGWLKGAITVAPQSAIEPAKPILAATTVSLPTDGLNPVTVTLTLTLW